HEAMRVVERIARGSEEASVPHQTPKERRVDHAGSTALVSWAGTVLAHEVVILDSNGDGLRVSETGGGGMAAGACIVRMQIGDLVEKEQPPEICQLGVHRPAQARLDAGAHCPGESRLAERCCQLGVQVLWDARYSEQK